MRPGRGWELRRALALLPLALLAGCPVRTPSPPAAATGPQPAPHLGRPYAIAGEQSLLAILVYRGGALASAGHNHLIASHELSGTFYVPDDPLQASFEVRIPLESLTVDEEALRAAQHSSDFPPGIPDSARAGTREHMLGADQLDAAGSPQILLRTLRLEPGPQAGMVTARMLVGVRGGEHLIAVPVRYESSPGEVVASGETPLRQSELGITAYSAMLGALQVQDELRVQFRIVARPAR